ncbi:MAG: DNA polymerase IV [Planctomycetaceae bacterium]|nr:DNA polymerase IV [Planctomycetaceae bacterium]
MGEAPRTILHVDMDAFYASVEQRDDPTLVGKPVLVGGREGRGVVCAASYEARVFGCRSAMPMAQAMRLCPHAAVVKPDFAKYTAASRAIRAIFERYSPEVEPLALDEAFIDATASLAMFGSGRAIGEAIRAAVRAELRLTCSVGVAPNKFVAKIASDLEKPDALVEIGSEGLAERLAPLAVERMWGVGPVASGAMHRLGYRTFGDLQRAGEAQLAQDFGDAGRSWHRLAHGVDDRDVVVDRAAKSVGEEETFPEDLATRAEVEARLVAQADEVGRRLRAKGVFAQTVAIKIRFSDFETHTHARTLATPTDHTHELRALARELLAEFAARAWRPVRLCGFIASRLGESQGQLPLFDDGRRERLARLDDVRDEIVRRFGVRRGE